MKNIVTTGAGVPGVETALAGGQYMSNKRYGVTRRDLLVRTVGGTLGGMAALSLPRQVRARLQAGERSRAALVVGDSRADNVFRSLKLIEEQIRSGLAGKKRVVLKPNMVMPNKQLSATHVDCLEAILEFLKPLVKDEITIADSAAGGRVARGYENYGFYRLEKKYQVKFVDLDEGPSAVRHVVDHRWYPRPVRLSRLLLDPETYIISSAVLKTHDRAVVTLSLKNVVVGAAIKDGKSSDKPIIHGGPANEGINYNLFTLAKHLRPDLAVIDGFQAMEGTGPISGAPVDHRIAIASTDWLAADRIGVEVMGFDFAKIGYLTFCARARLGQADLDKIEVLGEKVADHVRQYKPADNIEQQYKWMKG